MKLDKYKGNPILKPNPDSDWENCCVLNPAVVYSEELERFVMVYRAAGLDREHRIRLGLAYSEDGFNFIRQSDKPIFEYDALDPDGGCIEDPRITKIGNAYYMTYASRSYFPGKYWLTKEEMEEEDRTLGKLEYDRKPDIMPKFCMTNHTCTYLAYTLDFHTYKRLGRITDSRYDDRDVIVFPEQVNGKWVKISRPKRDNLKPSMWITFSDDLLEWGEPTKLYQGKEWWERERIGVSCPPIKTKDGWFLIYHGVDSEKEIYRVGFMLLDLEDPSKIIAKTEDYVMEPEEDYETCGIYNGCVFPCGNVVRNGILYVYYGTADKFCGVATKNFDEVMEYMRSLIK